MPTLTGVAAARIGFVLARIVVPLWILTGAIFKLYERVPDNLPSVIFQAGKDAGIDLDLLLRVLIGLELFAAGVMLLVPRLARAMAIFMLSAFCLIIALEMWRRATSCGCFGSIKIKPWQMLIIDGSLLLGVLIFPWRSRSFSDGQAQRLWAKPMLVSAILAVAGLGVAFAVPERPPVAQPVPQGESLADPRVNPSPSPLPASWYVQDATGWVGKPWREIDLFQMMPQWPSNMDRGKRFVIFYSRTCDHCETMFWEDLIIPQAAPVTAVEIPASPTQMTAAEAWEMPATPCEMMSLPLGPHWTITSPLAVTVENGIVICATEADHKKCMGIP